MNSVLTNQPWSAIMWMVIQVSRMELQHLLHAGCWSRRGTLIRLRIALAMMIAVVLEFAAEK